MAQVDDNTKREPKSTNRSSEHITRVFSLGGLLGGLGTMIEKLGELAEAGEQLSQSGELKDASGKIRGVYGINVKTAIGDQGQTELKVEPFGNVHRATAEAPLGEDVREPLFDIHEEEDHVLLLVELPGVSKESVELKMADGRLELSAARGKVTYHKVIDLPASCAAEHMSWECNNGILRVRFGR